MAFLIFFYPFAEFYLWIKFVEVYSFIDALYLIISGGLLGSIVMSLQGRAAIVSLMNSIQKANEPGRSPAIIIFHRALIWFGGLFIFLPGIISKIIGTILVLPGSRHLVLFYLKASIISKISSGAFRVFRSTGVYSNHQSPHQSEAAPNFFEENRSEEREVLDVIPIRVEHKNTESD
jgi:UPF0716 protein FxsA